MLHVFDYKLIILTLIRDSLTTKTGTNIVLLTTFLLSNKESMKNPMIDQARRRYTCQKITFI